MYFNFEKLSIYIKSLDYVDFVYKLTEQFPKSEQYALTDQFRRAAVSISLNIAEGSGGSRKEFIYFLRISNRSTSECMVCSEIAMRRIFISSEVYDASRNLLLELARMNSGLSVSLATPGDKRKSSTS